MLEHQAFLPNATSDGLCSRPALRPFLVLLNRYRFPGSRASTVPRSLPLRRRRRWTSTRRERSSSAGSRACWPLAHSHAVVRIANDRGGQIGRYVERYEQLRATGQTVMIDGLCASSCTIVLGAIPHEKICVTRNANLAFHAAWDFGARGQTITNPGATRMLYSMYPSQVRRWIANRGGLSPRMIYLRGRQLEMMYRPCYLDARVAVPR